MRRLQLERHEATRAAVAAESTSQDAQAKVMQLSHALAEAEQQRARAIEAHTSAEAENVELRRAVASEQEDKRAALAFRTAVEQEHAVAWAAAQKAKEAEAAAQQAEKSQQEAELASQIKAHREAIEYLEVAHAKKLTALQHQCRDLNLRVEKAQQEVVNSEAAREALLKREEQRRVADVAAVENKAQLEAEKHEVIDSSGTERQTSLLSVFPSFLAYSANMRCDFSYHQRTHALSPHLRRLCRRCVKMQKLLRLLLSPKWNL